MESFFSRHRNLIVLLAVLLAQIIGLAVQVRRPARGMAAAAQTSNPDTMQRGDSRSVMLLRLWATDIVTPPERLFHAVDQEAVQLWSGYLDLVHLRAQNLQLQQTIDRLRLEQAMLSEDARQGQRLQSLLHFQQSYPGKTLAAQVIGTSGNLQSHLLFIDKGSADGVRTDMAVISADGIVGKVRDVFPHTAQVLMINDQTSGAGVILEKTRIRGILRGDADGRTEIVGILADSRIQPGEQVLTAGGDQIFPRGLAVGTVTGVVRDPDRSAFIDVILKPAALLDRLDEVLVLTDIQSQLPSALQSDLAQSQAEQGQAASAELAREQARRKAAEEMAERLPGWQQPVTPANAQGAGGTQPAAPPAPKPIPALHPDRFSPGYDAGSSTAPAQNSPGDAASKPTTEKPQNRSQL
jgi:rod shape-determining protein MreC